MNLTSLTGLEGVNSIGEGINIVDNNSLTSLSGLVNINHGSIEILIIFNNILLSDCDVQSICNYLSAPVGTVIIDDNAPGCNSEQEVKEACGLSVDEINPINDFTISPNPFNITTQISYNLPQNKSTTIEIQNMNGQVVETIVPENNYGFVEITYDGSGLLPGIYFCVLKTNEGIQSRNIIRL
ncbi:MAG: T9SS type A sorting domain-containing protein [Bacteroidales bacterium]|nr:T9SS type A sorting domain-containing protein [Bacteroidales bacterium]